MLSDVIGSVPAAQREGDRGLIDHEQATLQAGWTQHCRVRAHLKERGLTVSPLMQVEVQAKGEKNPVKRVRDKLVEIRVDDAAIATHNLGRT